MLSQTRQLGVRITCGENLGVAGGNRAATFPLQRARHDGRATALPPAAHDPIDKLHQTLFQTHGNLLAHTNMVLAWDAARVSRVHDRPELRVRPGRIAA